jgi:extracellular elastinolytic metalloproteinase
MEQRMSRWHWKGRIAGLAAISTAVGLTGLATADAAPGPAATSTAQLAMAGPTIQEQPVRERMGFYDARQVSSSAQISLSQSVLTDPASAKVRSLQSLARPTPLVSINPTTGTPDNLTSLDGYLTSPSNGLPRNIVLSYVRDHASALGLTKADVGTLRLRSTYRDPAGIQHLSWIQTIDGIPVFGNGLRAHVAKDGRLISLQGAPVSGLRSLTGDLSTTPEVGPEAARETAAEDVGGEVDSDAVESESPSGATDWSNGDYSDPVWFVTADGARLAWSTFTQAGDTLAYSHVIDAETGDVLYRNDLVDFDKGDAKVYDYYPGADQGGSARVVNLVKRGWLKRNAAWLAGPNVSAFADVNDDNAIGTNEKTRVPGTKRKAQFTLQRFGRNPLCSPRFICTWNANAAFSWRKNKNADVTNAFYLANRFHDYLAQQPIGFTNRAGNFERVDGDPVLLNALDGANTANGFPDGLHIDNANMFTPPDGTPPTMQMYLWHLPKTPNALEPLLPTSGSFDASILYHEYTHGLSNRLVVDAAGNSTLNSLQAGSMGEAWSDYYAMDFLVTKGFQADSEGKDGQIRAAKYVVADQFPFRTMAMDCDPNSKSVSCTQLDGTTNGGYTYGDLSTIGGSPEVHSSGEVWAQTLWDVREKYGHDVAAMLISRGMELSPADPSMLDMRNAIIQADQVVYGGQHTPGLWRVFADRGMGWFAGSIDGGDVVPVEDFHVPPPAEALRGSMSGTVTDPDTGEPISDAIVAITGHDSGFVGSFSARTGADGSYAIVNVPPGTYQKVVVVADGREILSRQVNVPKNDSRVIDFQPRRDWAASSGGGSVTAFDGPDYTQFGCGPGGAIDVSQGTGWGSDTAGDDGPDTPPYPDPKSITIQLSRPIDIAADDAAFAVDPTATCGDPLSASTGEYTIEISTDGETWETAVDGTGDAAFTEANHFVYTDVDSAISMDDVEFVRFTIVSPQVPDFGQNCPDGPFGGCEFMDLTELEVFGTASE